MQRVGVYVDGFNLYYGGVSLLGKRAVGWKWLDIRGLARDLIDGRPEANWAGSPIHRIVYCTATIDSRSNASGYTRQQIFLKAIQASRNVDKIQYGSFVYSVKDAPRATPDAKTARPTITNPASPVMIQDEAGAH